MRDVVIGVSAAMIFLVLVFGISGIINGMIRKGEQMSETYPSANWHYVAVRQEIEGEVIYTLNECYPKIHAVTEHPVSPVGETVEELAEWLRRAAADVEKYPPKGPAYWIRKDGGSPEKVAHNEPTVENDVTNKTKPLSVGEHRVGVNFNPSGKPEVDEVKRLAARLIDMINEFDGSYPADAGRSRLKALAMTNIEQGAMWAVKALTR
jgi:hypothetical protein